MDLNFKLIIKTKVKYIFILPEIDAVCLYTTHHLISLEHDKINKVQYQ